MFQNILSKALSALLLVAIIASMFPGYLFALDTTFKSPTDSHSPEDWSNEERAFSSNDSYAVGSDDSDDNEQGYEDFNFSIPSGSVITGIEVRVEAKTENDNDSCKIETSLSWNDGSTYTSSKSQNVTSESDQTLIYGGSSDTWGRAWSVNDFTNSNFVAKFRVDDSNNSSGCDDDTDIRVDHIQVKVTYTGGDTTAPVITIVTGAQPVQATSPAGATGIFSASAVDTNPLSPVVTCSPLSGSTFGLGSTLVTCNATDTAGNIGTNTATITVVDTIAPVITLNGSAAINLVIGDTYTEQGATATDAVDTSLTIAVGGSVNTAAPGVYTITYNTSDDSGNAATQKTRTITVSDVVAPVIVVPANIVEEATAATGNVVNYSVTATDDVGVTSASCSPVSGSTFAIGTTAVNCTASDAAGHVANNAFSVTIQDTIAPVVTLSSVYPTVETTNDAGATAGFTATAADLIDADVAIVCDAVSEGLFPVGVTTVTCTGTDDSGNVGVASLNINILRNFASGGSTDVSPFEPLPIPDGVEGEEPATEQADSTLGAEEGGSTETGELPLATEETLAVESIDGAACTMLTSFIGKGTDKPEDVKFLQSFLNTEMNSTLEIDGIFGASTRDVVNAFQLKYAEEILAPWASFGIKTTEGTGVVYKTTQRMINMIACPGTDIPMPLLP